MTIKPEQFGAAGNQGTQTAGSEWGEQPMNVGNIERLVSILVGGIGLLLLSRRLFVYVTLALLARVPAVPAALRAAVPSTRAPTLTRVSRRISPPACVRQLVGTAGLRPPIGLAPRRRQVIWLGP